MKKTVEIDALAYGGDAVAHIDGRAVFVPDCVPGDVAEIEIVQDKGSFLRGTLCGLISRSPQRVEPFCPLADTCGGCQWQHIEYTAQLYWKQRIVRETLQRIGGIGDIDVEPCSASPINRGYRTVARYPARMTKHGLIFGYYKRKSHRIVDITSCPVAEDRVNKTASSIRLLINERFSSLDVRELTLNSSHYFSLLHAGITLGGLNTFSEDLEVLLSYITELSGISFYYAAGQGKIKHIKTYGDRRIYESINGRKFRIDERSFFQINIPQTERLVDTVIQMIGGRKVGRLVDGYGGVGLFSMSLAQQDTDIYLFDTSAPAVRDSKYNARTNGFTRFHAITEPAKKALKKIGNTDLLILDPPRTGLGFEAVRAAYTADAGIIVYVSCNPATLARDVKVFSENSYRIVQIVPVDMFPHTYHIETVVKMERC